MKIISNTKKKKTIIGKRVRVVVGNTTQFKDNNNVVILGEDTTLVVSSEEAKEAERIVGEEIIVHVGDFDRIIRRIDEKEYIDARTKEDLKRRIVELEEELRGDRNKDKIKRILKYIKDNATWLVPVISDLLKTYTRA